MATASGAASASSGGYAGKAHELVPEFSGKASDYKEYRKRLMLYEKKMALAGREKETCFNVMCTLRGRAWDACEDIPMDQLEGSGSMKAVLDRLDKVFKFDAITELPNDFETFFVTLARRKGSTLQEYSGDFERALRKLGQHGVDLPDKVVGWYYLRRAGLSQNQRQMVLSSIGTETLSLENVRRVMNFVIGQDSVPDGGVDHRSKMNRWKSPFPMKESIYFEEDELVDDYQDWEDDMAIMFADADQFWGSKEAEDPEEFEEFDDEVNIVSDDMAAEYDDILAGYTEARQRLNALRMSRGYYPVVAMVPDGASGKGSNYSVNKGKGKSKKGKGGGGKQSPKAPSAKARGRAALGADKCLRCGQAGHRARNCPAAGKRKADTSVEADVNMVADSDEVQLVAPESDIQDDIAMMDCGAGSVLTSEERLKTYLRFLETSGFDVNAIPVFRCKKGFKFGNGEKNITSVCVLVPTFMEGQRRDILMYVIPGSAPVLFGRPLMEALDISINYSSGKVKWGKKAWKQSPRGSRGEFICHMAADLPRLAKKEPAKVLLPDDFEQHVHPELLSIDVFFNGKAEDMLNVAEDAVNSVTEAASFSSAAGYGLQKVHEACEKSAILPHHGGTMPPNSSPEFQSAMLSSDDDDVVLQELTDPGADATESVASPTENREALHRLPAGKLRQLLYDTEARIKEFDAILQATQVKGAKKKFKVWEVFAGEGRVTKTANRREKLEAERFSLVEGWDFADAKRRMAFLRQLRREDPDVVLLSPMCKLWSQLQELNIAAHPGYAEKLNEQRIWDHDNILMFCAIVYEHQRRRKKIATCEHPQKSRAWQTQAFETMQGWDAHIDQCMFGLRLPNEENVMLPVQKPTTFRVTSETLQKRLERRCNGKHKHTHLEGSIPGVGLRSWLAESYPQLLATHIVDCILQELESPDYNYILATEEVPEPLDGENTRLEEPQHAAEVKDKDLQLESSQFQDLDPVRRNRVLRAQVGPRAVEYVQRLHKNLGHPGWEVLYRMLQEVQATDNVLQAAKFYTCPLCYARKPPKQSPPASGLKCTEFNDRILVDSHWIACEESIVKEREPAPGTPAARRKAKDKKEKRPTGRQCVLTIIDHATRYCSIRILKSERADEFTKGLERSWIKHFGMPKILRIDEAKGWSSEHVRNWATQRGITLEVQPAENHTWLGVVERKHQVIRRALELYMDQNDNHGLATLKEAVYYVPHSINQLSFHKGFTPQQWVLGKSMTYVHGLSGEFFNPAQEAIDEQGHFAQVQERRARAARAFIAADSDAKLRRAFNQKFAEMQEELVIGQKVWFWRKNLRRLHKSGWRGPARIVAIEEQPNVNVYWLCHGTSLVRCGARQVRPMVEDTGMPVVADRKAALRDLQELKARSTTQFKDELRKSGRTEEAEELDEEEAELDAEYEPSLHPSLFEDGASPRVTDDEEEKEEGVPGVVSVFLPQLAERERTPRRRESIQSTAAPPTEVGDMEMPEAEGSSARSPKRKSEAADSSSREEKAARMNIPETVHEGDEGTTIPDGSTVPIPVQDDDDLIIEEVFLTELPADAPEGWHVVDGWLEMDDVYMAAIRKGEVNERKLKPDERAQFVEGKKNELNQYFSNAVWQVATEGEIENAIKNKRVITARWVLIWKRIDDDDGVARWKAKARLVLRGFQDPHILQ